MFSEVKPFSEYTPVFHTQIQVFVCVRSYIVNMVENDARCTDKNVKILVRYQWMG